MVWFQRILKTIILASVLVCGFVFFILSSSKPTLNGDLTTSVSDNVTIDRDEQGIATIHANERTDVAFALGFLHAQERYFQMDLLRRNSAGELSELFGDLAVNFDSKIRQHQFRKRAHRYVQLLPQSHQDVLDAYTQGVNKGLATLAVKPFEYFLLNKTPTQWLPEDSMLVLYSMYIDLQHEYGQREWLLGRLKTNLMSDVYQFLNPLGSTWDAAIDGSQFPESPIPENNFEPAPVLPELVHLNTVTNPIFDTQHEEVKGSNSWVVSGSISQNGSAILANDMHLGIGVPNIWYRAGFRYQSQKTSVAIDGVTLPGTPAMVVGSNRHVAWGFTNSYGDWSELIKLKVSNNGLTYQTPQGDKPFVYEPEVIRIKGQPSQSIEVKTTIWGPVIHQDELGNQYVLRWTAHDPEGVNFNLLELEQATSTQQATAVAHKMAIPAQNIVIADNKGNIAWTIAGPMPRKVSKLENPDWQIPQDWSNGAYRWDGYLTVDEKPVVINPDSKRIWTGNSRIIGGEDYHKIGNGGYALGARAQQIRDGLFNVKRFSESDLLDIQNDDRAIFLNRWHEFLLNRVLTEQFIQEKSLTEAVSHLQNWQGRASINSVGYSIVEAFRRDVRDTLFANLLNPILHKDPNSKLSVIRHQLETPLWALINEQPEHIRPSGYESWQSFLEVRFLITIDSLSKEYGELTNANWGNVNRTQVQHPLAKAIPALSWLLDMPSDEVNGDSYMPRVQGPDFGSSERFVVSPGHERQAILHMPSGQSGHPLSPYYGKGHHDWVTGTATPLLAGKTKYTLTLTPETQD